MLGVWAVSGPRTTGAYGFGPYVELEPLGTMECPYCSKDTPHHHSKKSIAGMVAGLIPRLTRVADELANHVGFYGAMHRAYGTGYGYDAEAALRADLQIVVRKLAAQAIEAQRAETENTGSVACDESAVGKADAPSNSSSPASSIPIEGK